MEDFFLKPPSEKTPEPKTQMSLEDKIQKLIKMCTTYKEKYDALKIDFEKTLTSNIELEDEKTQIISEKHFLEQRVIQLDAELQEKMSEIEKLNASNNELDNITKTAALRIDKLLSECEFDI
ncbi:MAG: hypothetical protein FWG98_00515 [Candidatus Cloacimonetes bacterium]|nr:hypothetical protein [Candidatus Cloacimonadota bacterium]